MQDVGCQMGLESARDVASDVGCSMRDVPCGQNGIVGSALRRIATDRCALRGGLGRPFLGLRARQGVLSVGVDVLSVQTVVHVLNK